MSSALARERQKLCDSFGEFLALLETAVESDSKPRDKTTAAPSKDVATDRKTDGETTVDSKVGSNEKSKPILDANNRSNKEREYTKPPSNEQIEPSKNTAVDSKPTKETEVSSNEDSALLALLATESETDTNPPSNDISESRVDMATLNHDSKSETLTSEQPRKKRKPRKIIRARTQRQREATRRNFSRRWQREKREDVHVYQPEEKEVAQEASPPPPPPSIFDQMFA